MKKQKGQSKSKELQERLITGQSFQLVNPRNFGTAHSRNERQHEKRMKSLHNQQHKRLAKLDDEMDEVRAQQRLLKEVDESTRDARSAVERLTGINSEETAGRHDVAAASVPSRVREMKYPIIVRVKGVKEQTLSVISTSRQSMQERSKSANHEARARTREEPTGCASRTPRQKSGNGFPGSTGAVGSSRSFLNGLLDIRVKRDASLSKRYNYNLREGDDLNVRESRRRQGTSFKQSNEDTELSRHPRENRLLNRTRGGKPNTANPHEQSGGRQHAELIVKTAEEASNHGRGIRVMTSRSATDDVTPEKVHEKRSVRFHEHGPRGTELAGMWSSDDERLDESPTEPSEKNWAQTLRKCRYLRKPKGYESPEIPIEVVFQQTQQ